MELTINVVSHLKAKNPPSDPPPCSISSFICAVHHIPGVLSAADVVIYSSGRRSLPQVASQASSSVTSRVPVSVVVRLS